MLPLGFSPTPFSYSSAVAAEEHVFIGFHLKNIKDLPEMEKVFFDYFEADACPARMTSTTEFIDSDCLFMMDGAAYHPSSH